MIEVSYYCTFSLISFGKLVSSPPHSTNPSHTDLLSIRVTLK